MEKIVSYKKCSKCLKTKSIHEFYVNKARKDGHSSMCKACDNENNKRWAKNNADKIKGYLKKWQDAHVAEERERLRKFKREHREKIREEGRKYNLNHRAERIKYDKDYREKNKDRLSKRDKEYLSKHPEKNIQFCNNRRARKKFNGGDVSSTEWLEICKKYGNKCLCCGKKTRLTMDHVIPLSLGGKHEAGNIQPLCGSCNSKKHTKIIDYRPKL